MLVSVQTGHFPEGDQACQKCLTYTNELSTSQLKNLYGPCLACDEYCGQGSGNCTIATSSKLPFILCDIFQKTGLGTEYYRAAC